MVTGSAWRSEWNGWDEAEALHAICTQLAKHCDAATLAQLDSVTISSWGAHGLDPRGRHLFTEVPVKDVN